MFRFLLILFAFAVGLSGPGISAAVPASAPRPGTLGVGHALRQFGGSIIVPPEWAGIWAIEDSTFDCPPGVPDVISELDTLCTGQNVFEAPSEVLFPVDCTGTVDATSVDVTCTGMTEIIPDCTATFTSHYVATRTGESYHAVTTVLIEYAGTGEGCDFFPSQCIEVHTGGTRIAPEPTAYCSTPVAPSTWGRVKARYR